MNPLQQRSADPGHPPKAWSQQFFLLSDTYPPSSGEEVPFITLDFFSLRERGAPDLDPCCAILRILD